MSDLDRLRHVELFADLSDDDLERICQGVEDRALDEGEVLFEEGDEAEHAYVVVSGELEVIKKSAGRERLLALRGPGSAIGEIALLQNETRTATVRARVPTDLLSIPRAVLEQLLDTSPSAARSMFGILLARLRGLDAWQRQNDRMAQLGTLTAGVAHELNNPASAAKRAAERLADALGRLGPVVAEASHLEPDAIAAVAKLAAREQRPPSDPLARSDAEDEIERWLADRGIAESWTIAPELVESGVTVGDLDTLAAGTRPELVPRAITLLLALALPSRLARQVAEASARVSDIVSTLRTYSYLDRSHDQLVDIHDGLEGTLTLLGHALKGITVVRDYDDELPPVTGSGAELNQAWTNLIDNAAYELSRAGVDDPTLTIRTYREHGEVIVEIEDNGRGIPDEVRPRIFDAFYTTKPPGEGTGQGLNLAYQVVFEHGGELSVESAPGRTVFRVVLPT